MRADLWLPVAVVAKTTLILGAALLLTRAMRARPAAERHLVWVLAAVAVLVLPALALALPAWRVSVPVPVAAVSSPAGASHEVDAAPVSARFEATSASAAISEFDATSASAAIPEFDATSASAAISGVDATSAAAGMRAFDAAAAAAMMTAHDATTSGADMMAFDATSSANALSASDATPAAAMIPTLDATSPDASAAERAFQAVSAGALIVFAWLIGVIVVGLAVLLGFVRVQRLARGARPLRDPALQARARGVAAELGVTRRVRLLEGDVDAMPITFGVLRASLLLPASARGWSAARQQAVLRHELAHVRRRDSLTQLIAEVACAVHWFNPLVWVAARRLCVEREHACDDAVLAAGARPADYAAELLDIARTMRAQRVASLAAIAMARPSQLRARLQAVLEDRRRSTGVSRRLLTPAWIGAVVLVTPLSTLVPAFTPVEIGASVVAAVDTPPPLPVPIPPTHPTPPLPAPYPPAQPYVSGVPYAHPLPYVSGVPYAQPMPAPSLAPLSPMAPPSLLRPPSPHAPMQSFGAPAAVEPLPPLSPPGTWSAMAPPAPSARSFEFSLPAAPAAPVAPFAPPGMMAPHAPPGMMAPHAPPGLMAPHAPPAPLAPGVSGVTSPASPVLSSPSQQVDCLSGGRTTNMSSNSNDDRRTIKWSGPNCSGEVVAEGTVTFDPSFSTITGLSRGGYIRIEIDEGRDDRRVVIRPANGGLSYEYTVGGTRRDWDADGRAWLDAQLMFLFRRAGFMADERASAMLRQGGPGAVLAEVDQLRSDYIRSAYLTVLVRDGQLDESTLRRVLTLAGNTISSDYYRTNIVTAVAGRYTFTDGIRNTYIDAVSGIGSDYYQHAALSALLSKGDLTVPQTAAVLRESRRIGSDYYRASLLQELSGKYVSTPALRSAYLEAAGGISSDYYRAAVLSSALDSDGIRSDDLPVLLNAAGAMSSDYYAQSVLSRVAARNDLDRASLIALIDATTRIRSDHYASTVLVEIANRHTLAGDVRERFLAAMDGIRSSTYRGRVADALLRRSR